MHGAPEQWSELWSEQGFRRPLGAAAGFVLISLFVMAGALGIALGVALGALLALPPWHRLKTLLPLNLAFSSFLLFIAWAWVTTLWSPYHSVDQALKMTAGAFIYGLFPFAVWTLRGRGRDLVFNLALYSALAMFIPYLVEGTTGVISHLFAEGAAREAMLRDATRGVSAIVMASPALIVLVMQRWPGRSGRIVSVGVFLAALAISFLFSLSAGVLASVLGGIFLLVGFRYPRSAVLGAILLLVAMITLAPIVLPLLTRYIDADTVSFSWGWRLKMWPYVVTQIDQHALVGWGLDASRTFTADKFQMHGFSLSYLAMHPHNIGLHIWLETGLVGVMLSVTTLLLLGISIASQPQLSPWQGAAIAGSMAAFFVFATLTYGAWQEWLWACVAWVAALCVLAGPSDDDHQEANDGAP